MLTELNGAESEEDRIVAIIKTHEAKWLLEFICPSELQHSMRMTATNDRPVLSSERAPHIDKTATV
jgi:hypothetical protein